MYILLWFTEWQMRTTGVILHRRIPRGWRIRFADILLRGTRNGTGNKESPSTSKFWITVLCNRCRWPTSLVTEAWSWTPTYRTVLPTANFLLLLCCLCVVSAAFRSVVECRFWSRLGPKTGGSFTEVKRWGHAAFFFLPFGHRVCNGSMDPLVAFFEPLPHRQV